jgi:hypothetical protein
MRRSVSTIAVAAAATAGLVAAAAPAGAAGPTSWTAANSVATGDQDGAAVATNRIGDVAVAWEDDRDTTNPADDTHSEIYLRLFRAGTSAYEIKLSAGGTAGKNWKHVKPDVGLDDRGNAVVVWSDDPDGNATYNVAYRVVSPAGKVTASGHANGSSAGQQLVPRVAVDPDGAPKSTTAVAFTAVWEDIPDGATVATVKAAGFSAAGTKAYEVTVNATGGSHHNPDVAVSAAGDALVVWDEDTDGNGYDNVGLTRLSRASGAVVLTRRSANSLGDGQQRHARIAADFTGDFVVGWESDHTGTNGVWVRSFAPDGTPRHTEVQVSTGTAAAGPSVGIDDQANAVVGWSVGGTDPAVWAAGVNPDGTRAGRLPAQSVSQVTTGRQEQPAVAVSPYGEVATTYTDDNDGNGFDQVLLGEGATNSDW